MITTCLALLLQCQGTLIDQGDAGGADDSGPVVSDASVSDAGPIEHDAGSVETDAGSAATDAGSLPIDAGPIDAGAQTECVNARRLWADGFETGDYRQWSSGTYGDGWGNGCENNALTTSGAHSGTYANRSEITCASSTDVHRGYGGVQFSGDTPQSTYTNSGVGIAAPNGVVNTFWTRLETPYAMGDGRWVSLFTTNSDCAWSERVITLGLEDAGMRLTPAHILATGGTVTFSPGAPSFPRGQWVRVTVYINYYTGEMHVWQDGTSVLHATFTRPTNDICQWHWGLYASGNNTNVVLTEDDKSIWKLEEPWTDFTVEPWFDGPIHACGLP